MEPERHIEKVIREYAQERRAKAGDRFSLHPATRRQLQAEVARLHAKPAPPQRGFFDVFLLLGRHPGWSASFTLLMLTFIGWWLLREPQAETGRLMAARDIAPLAEMVRADRNTSFASEPPATSPTDLALAAPPAPAPSAPAASQPNLLSDARSEPDLSRSHSPASESVAKKETLFRDELASAKLTADKDFTRRYGLAIATNAPQPGAGTALPRSEVATSPPQPQTVHPQSELAISQTRGGRATPQFDTTPTPLGAETDRGRVTPPTANLGISYERIQTEFEPASNQFGGLAAAKLDSPTVATSGASGLLNSEQGYSVRQNFARSPAPLAKAKSATPTRQTNHDILNNFELRQNGVDIELVDADGSVYRGKLDEPAPTSTQASLSERPVTALDATANKALSLAPAQTQNQALGQQNVGIPFRVAGTNRTLRQAVVFNGEFQNQTANLTANAPLSNQSSVVNNQAQRQFQNTIQNSLSNSQISGRLRVGKEPETELLAVPKGGN